MVDVSVIIPVYNSEKWLGACLDSVLGQTLRTIEVLVVDDGSSDGSQQIIAEYAARDSRVVALPSEHHGAGESRNRGLDVAHGRYVAFMDSDDLYPNDLVLERMVHAADSSGSLVTGGFMVGFSDCKPTNLPACPVAVGSSNGLQGICLYSDFQSPFGFTCYLYNRDFLNERHLRFPNKTRFEDPIFFVKAMTAAKRFYSLNQCVYLYRQQHKTVDVETDDFKLLREQLSGGVELLKLAVGQNLTKLASLIMRETLGAVCNCARLAAVEQQVCEMIHLFKDNRLLRREDWQWLAHWLVRDENVVIRVLTILRLIGMKNLLV